MTNNRILLLAAFVIMAASFAIHMHNHKQSVEPDANGNPVQNPATPNPFVDHDTTTNQPYSPATNQYGEIHVYSDPSKIPLPTPQLSLPSQEVEGGNTENGVIDLSTAAPRGGWTVPLSVVSGPALQLPSKLHIPGRQYEGHFQLKAPPVSTRTPVVIRVGTAPQMTFFTLTIIPPVPCNLSFKNPMVACGDTIHGTVTLNGTAPVGGVVVNLGSDNNLIITPKTVTVPYGKTSTVFDIRTVLSSTSYGGNISVDANGNKIMEPVASMAHNLCNFTVNIVSISAGAGGKGTVSLTGPAGQNDIVNLTTNNPNFLIPPTVRVPPGKLDGEFPIQTTKSASGTGTLTASKGTDSYQVSITIGPAAPSALKATLKAGTVVLNWKGVRGAGGYAIYRSEKRGGPYSSVALNDSAISLPTQYIDKSAQLHMKYYYTIATVDGALNEGSKCQEACVTIP